VKMVAGAAVKAVDASAVKEAVLADQAPCSIVICPCRQSFCFRSIESRGHCCVQVRLSRFVLLLSASDAKKYPTPTAHSALKAGADLAV
jgi:hypothetical protein